MKRILVLGGMHGNEQLGIELVRSLKNQPIPGVDAIIANPRAVKSNTRFTESDLNRSFGTEFQGTYESKRADYIRQVARQYSLVLDFHNTMTPNNNASFIGVWGNSELLSVSAKLGLLNCIEATYDCINKFCPNTISIEISQNDTLDSVEYWRRKLTQLLNDSERSGPEDVNLYQYLRRVTWGESEKVAAYKWRPFQAIPGDDARILGINQPAYPIFIGSRLTEYYATLLIKKELNNEI